MTKNSMKHSPSISIEYCNFDISKYKVTANAKNVALHLVNGYKTGFHSFNIIGSYGTGKSSFILALEDALKNSKNTFFKYNENVFNEYKNFEFLNIVGDYSPLLGLLRKKLNIDGRQNFFSLFESYYNEINKKGCFLIIVIDEFGKILEHAVKNNPEEELYFVQQFTEFVNDQNKNILFVSTLHQNFSSYANKLTKVQRNEWEKVKGRFKEIVFNEPVEQLIFLAAEYLKENNKTDCFRQNHSDLLDLAIKTKFINPINNTSSKLAENIYPLDAFSTYILTLAIQRYGQNERSLFSFLESEDTNGIKQFVPTDNETYNISDVHDYVSYNFHSFLTEINQDSVNWTALKAAIEKVEGRFDADLVCAACKIVKTIGLLNIFAKQGSKLDYDFLVEYSEKALGINDAKSIIDKLEKLSVIRYAIYKSQYILFEGSDLDIELELANASTTLRKASDISDKLKQYFKFNIIPAKAVSYRTGTPRYFDIKISNHLERYTTDGDIDGHICLLFSDKITDEELIVFSEKDRFAILYGHYKNTSQIADILFEIDKYDYVLDYRIDKFDRIAKRELEKGKQHIIGELNNIVLNSMFKENYSMKWVFRGNQYNLSNKTQFNQLLSMMCKIAYSDCPVYKMEMLNKQKLTGTMSSARKAFLEALLDHKGEPELGFGVDKFPPQRTIYKTLLQSTGVYRKENIGYVITPPEDHSFMPLWNACETFFDNTKGKAKKVSELFQMLCEPPFKMKQALIETWVLAYLILRKEDYSLYSEGTYVPKINKQVLDLILRNPSDFTIKAFNVSGVRLNLFNKYREIINLEEEETIEESSFIETIRPFLTFYKALPDYTKQTKKLSKDALDLKEVLAKAKDPEETFFVDLPNALGFIDVDLNANDKFLADFVTILQSGIKELRTSYSDFLNRMEAFILNGLGIDSMDYSAYKPIINKKYKNVKDHLLSSGQKTFYTRTVANMKDREAWFNSIAYPFLNKPLEAILDEEEEWLFEKLKYSFTELDNYIKIQDLSEDDNEEVLKFDLTSAKLGTRSNQLMIPKKRMAEVEKLEKKLMAVLSTDDQINLYALIKLIDKKL